MESYIACGRVSPVRRLPAFRRRHAIFLDFGRGAHDGSCSVPSDHSGRPSIAGGSVAAIGGLPLHVLPIYCLVTRAGGQEAVEIFSLKNLEV